jgi:hypothetical protein
MSERQQRREPYRPIRPIKAAGTGRSFAVPPNRVVPVEVDDPYGSGKIVALRSGRDDPLGWLHAHRHIDDHQFAAGRRYQRDVEVSEGGLRGFDPTREKVDGSAPTELMIDAALDALKSRQEAEAAMGVILAPIAHDVIVAGMSYSQIALKKAGLYYGDEAKCKGGPLYGPYEDPLKMETQRANSRADEILGDRKVSDIGVLFRSALDCLVIYYGMQTRLALN